MLNCSSNYETCLRPLERNSVNGRLLVNCYSQMDSLLGSIHLSPTEGDDILFIHENNM